MAQKFNQGVDTSDIDVNASQVPGQSDSYQIHDKHWSRRAVIEAKKKKIFSQLGDALTQPKNFGDKIVKYHEFPILDDRNVNDQGIDANGVTMKADVWYLYLPTGGRHTGNADADGGQGYSTYVKAREEMGNAAVNGMTIKSGNGNLFGGSKDLLVQQGAFPALTEEGGMVDYDHLGLAA